MILIVDQAEKKEHEHQNVNVSGENINDMVEVDRFYAEKLAVCSCPCF